MEVINEASAAETEDKGRGHGGRTRGAWHWGAAGEEPSYHFLVFTRVSPLCRTGVAKPSDSRSTVGAQPAGSWVVTLLWHLASAVGTEVYTTGYPPLSGLLDLAHCNSCGISTH